MANLANGSASREAKAMLELKKKAIQYYTENGVPKKMEEILNSTFYDNPHDVYGHLANYFEAFQKTPTITKVVSREALDGKGQSTLQTEVYCMVKNFEKLQAISLCSNKCSLPDSVRQEDKELAEQERQSDISRAIELINTDFNQMLNDLDPTNQHEIDSLLTNAINKMAAEEAEHLAKEQEDKRESGEADDTSAHSPVPQDSKSKAKSPKGKGKGPAVVVIPDEPREKFICGSTAVCALSQAIASSAAAVKQVPLYEHIASCRFDEVPQTLSLPLPMVTVLMSGRLAPGKLNCIKEYMIIPKPGMSCVESIKHITNIYNYCAKSLSSKTGIVSRAVNDLGALWTAFDRPEQGLDLIQEAMMQYELTPGKDFHIALNCAGHEIFDYDKGKYEVIVGQQKPAEDLADFWSDILDKYPAVIALIDPMRKQEHEAWMRLCEAVSSHCFVVGDKVFHRPGLLKDEEQSSDFRTSGVIFCMEHITSISDIISACKKMEDANNEIILGTSDGETTDTFIVDLAVGCKARFLKLGAPCRGERIVKLNRLIQIESELKCSQQIELLKDHVFPLIKPPTPVPEENEENNKQTEEK